MGDIALVREQKVYVCAETTIGTLVAPTAAVPAKGTITLTGIPSALDTITIGDETWTFKATRATPYQITIGVSASATVTNIVTAINADSAEITAEDGDGDTVVVTCNHGKAANYWAFTESASNLTMNGAGVMGATQTGTDGNMLVTAGPCTINQTPSFTDSPEIVDSRDVLERFQDTAPPGEFAIPIIARPSGHAGYEPMGDLLYESLMCHKTTNTGVSIVYDQDLSKPSFSLWVKKSHSVLFASGCAVTQAKFSVSNKGAVQVDFSGNFFKLGWVGTDSLHGSQAHESTSLVVHDAKKFSIGGLIKNGTSTNDPDNGGSGYAITNVVVATNTLTISPHVPVGGWGDNDVIEPFLPLGAIIGHPIESRHTAVTLDGVSTTIKTMELTVADDAKFMDDEITTTGYPESYVEDVRAITGTLGLRFRKDQLSKFYDGYQGSNVSWELIFGNAAGKYMKINLPKVNQEVPKIDDNKPVVDLSIPIKALGISGEDSMTITFY